MFMSLLVGYQEGHSTCKKPSSAIPKAKYCFRDLAWSGIFLEKWASWRKA